VLHMPLLLCGVGRLFCSEMKGGKRRESVKFVPKAFPYRISVTVTETGKTIKG
jgi:hypothetical protein